MYIVGVFAVNKIRSKPHCTKLFGERYSHGCFRPRFRQHIAYGDAGMWFMDRFLRLCKQRWNRHEAY